MRLLYRALFSVVVGVLVASAAYGYWVRPVPVFCGQGGFSFDNSFANPNASTGPPFGADYSSWPSGASIQYSWYSNGSVNLTIVAPGGGVISTESGTYGSGSFAAEDGSYEFELPPPPPTIGVWLNFTCTTMT
jgi:hypothetical protein